MSASPAADRNLLFGVLALQMNFVKRDGLITAMHAWSFDKTRPLGRILLDQGQLTAQQLAAIDKVLELNLQLHGDAERSLQAMSALTPVESLLASVADPDLQGSVMHLSTITRGESTGDPVPMPSGGGRRYRILRPHAKGGLGEVFVAEDTELHREVALKQIQAHRAHDAASRGRFVLEAEVTGGLEHPGIVPVYGLGMHDDGRPYYAMRFIRGDSLKKAIERFHDTEAPRRDSGERALALRGLLRRFVDVCNAIAYAHSRGVLHRDVKPANVMLGKFGETLVVDWGLAKPGMGSRRPLASSSETTADPTLRPSSGSATTGTLMGSALGTPAYMSPEQAAGKLDELGPTSDIYSLGATLYTLLTGNKAFDGTDNEEVLKEVRAGRFTAPRVVNPRVPLALDAISRKAMAMNPADRYSSALDLAADVEHWLADEPVSAYPEPWPARAGRWARRHRTAVVSAAVLLVTATVGLAFTTLMVVREQRETLRQKRIAEENYELARDLSYNAANLIAASEAEFASNPASHAARKAVLMSAASAFRQHLAARSGDPELRAHAAQVYRYAANVHRLEVETDQAEPLYRDAIDIYEGLAKQFPSEANYRLALAEVLRDYATVQTMLGKLADAAASLRHAIELIETPADSGLDRPWVRRTLAATLLDRAANELTRGQEAEGSRTAARATAILEKLATLPPAEHHPYDAVLLASALNLTADAERKAGRKQEGQVACDRAIALLTKLAKSPPAGLNSLDVIHVLGCIRVEECRAMVKSPELRVRVEKNLAEAARIWEQLAGAYPQVPMYREWLAYALQVRSEFLVEAGRPDEAKTACERSLKLQEKLVDERPAVPSYKGDLGRTRLGLGRIARSAGEPVAAKAWFERAADALGKALEQSPECDRDRHSLEEVKAEMGK